MNTKVVSLLIAFLTLCVIAPAVAQVVIENPNYPPPPGVPVTDKKPCNGIFISGHCIPGFELPLSLAGILIVAYLQRRQRN